jgi:hypothetical protein
VPQNPAATAAWNDSPDATIMPPTSMVPGLIRKLNMMLKRSNQPTVWRSSGTGSMPYCSTPAGWR